MRLGGGVCVGRLLAGPLTLERELGVVVGVVNIHYYISRFGFDKNCIFGL